MTWLIAITNENTWGRCSAYRQAGGVTIGHTPLQTGDPLASNKSHDLLSHRSINRNFRNQVKTRTHALAALFADAARAIRISERAVDQHLD